MSNYEVKNAIIEYTKLGVAHTEHGILSFVIGLNYGGGGQGYGQLCLDNWSEEKKKRVPTELASGLLLAIDEVFGLDWEKLKGISCRAYSSHGKVAAIGHYLEDKWMWFSETEMSFKVTPFAGIKV